MEDDDEVDELDPLGVAWSLKHNEPPIATVAFNFSSFRRRFTKAVMIYKRERERESKRAREKRELEMDR